jgi:hypothetical protein
MLKTVQWSGPARLAASIIIILCGISSLSAAGLKTLPGHLSTFVSGLTPKERLPATNELRLAIGLPLHNGEVLAAFMSQLYDPASPGYRQYLTPEEFTARFGPTAGDYESVKDFARTNGLTIVGASDNRLLLDVTGTAASVERAFHIKLFRYHHPSENRDFFAPDTEPAVDASLPVADVQGLSNLGRPSPKFVRKSVKAARNKSGSAPDGSGEYFGNDFRNAYAPGVTLTGAGQSVALFEADGFYAADISYYASNAGNGRANIAIQTVLVDSFSGIPTTGSDSGNPEVSLDIEMAMSMAPGLSTIVVVEGNPNNYIPNDILSGMLATSSTVKILSSSWGWTNGPSTTTDNIFTNMAAVGQSFFNASGDSCAFTAGSNSVNGVDNIQSYNAPSDSPIITQVGGTTLTSGSGGAYASETVWNWGIELGSRYNGVGSSGGVSSHYNIPSWQATVSGLAARGGSTSSRNIPDVAMTADNVYVRDSGGNNDDLGGTSCAAPLWAGFIALVNQQAATYGKPGVGFVNPAIYSIASGASYSSCFNDVTTGNNTWSDSTTLFYATTGYDLCTGLGSPAGIGLINALAPPVGLIVSPLSGAGSGYVGGPFTISSGTFQLNNTSSSPLTWSLINTSNWLAFSATNGTLGAGGQTTVTASLTAAANSLTAGTYAANLTFSNVTAQTAQNIAFTLQVNQPLVVSPTNGFNAAGPVGGPFNITSQNYSLTNLGENSLSWSISGAPSWLKVSPASGTLSSGGQTSVTVSLASTANSLGANVYTASLPVTSAAGIAATLPFTLSVGQSIVSNGGFEAGSFAGWTLNASTKYDFVTSTSTFVHSGTYGAVLGQSGSLGTLSQTVATVPGESYVFSFWLENPVNSTGATPNQFVALWNGTTLFNQSNIPFISWTNLQFVVSASGTSSVIEFEFEDTPYYLGLDDVGLTPVSAPVFKAVPQSPPAFNLSWSAISGVTYQVQYSTNLAQTNWINLGAPQTASSGTLSFSDTNAISSSPARFYRVTLVP